MDSVLSDLNIDEPSDNVGAPIDTDMADILPESVSNTGAVGADKKEKKLSKEEKKAMKKQKKRQREEDDDEEQGEDTVKMNGVKKTTTEVKEIANGVDGEKKKKKREKHKHGKE